MSKGWMPVARAAFAMGLACLLGPAAALAQWNPSLTRSLGQSYGQLALSQSVLTGTRLLGAGTTSGTAAGANGAGGGVRAASPSSTRSATQDRSLLTYIPDSALSDRTRANVIDTLCRQNPTLRGELEQVFAGNAVLKFFDEMMTGEGYSSRNLADDVVALLTASWEISVGKDVSDEQLKGLHRQIRAALLGSPRIHGLSNADRQQMAELIAYQVAISSAARELYLKTHDQPRMRVLRQSATQVLRQYGIEPARARLTERGFAAVSR